MARLSVVAPFHDVERYLERCLRSLAQQTFDDLEVVLVDDGSRDGSRAIAERFVDDDPRFRLVTQENRGLGPARNTGLEHASGDLVAFADTDDLVTRHGYELLVGSLDATGSDLAAGGARRFTSLWLRNSYSHRAPFARTRLATHVVRDPLLVADRTVWNKVYRRDFWDRHGFSFPEMLYEDYPVTMAAHLAAGAVDVLHQPVYLWREREGGEPSITQARWDLGNLRDRVRSAELVLDHVAAHEPALLPHVEAHLMHVDVDAVVAALRLADPDERPEILALARTLLGRVREEVRAAERPFERLQAALVDGGDLDRLLVLLEHREQRGPAADVVLARRVPARWAHDLPYRGDPAVDQTHFAADAPEPVVAAEVAEASWKAGLLHLRGRVGLVGVEPAGTTARFTLVRGEASPVSLPAEVDGDGGFALTLNPYVLGAKPADGTWRLVADVRSGRRRASGPVRMPTASPAGWVRAETLGGDRVVQPVAVRDGEAALQVRTLGTSVLRLTSLADRVEVEGVVRDPDVGADLELVLARGWGEPLVVPAPVEVRDDGQVRFTAMVEVDVLDPLPGAPDPMEEDVAWTVRLRSRGEDRGIPVQHRVGTVIARSRGRQLRAGRNARGNLALHLGPVTAAVESVAWDGDRLLLAGTLAAARTRGVSLSLHCQPGGDVRLVEEAEVSAQGGLFTATVDVAALVARSPEADPARRADEPVRWQLAVVEDGELGRMQLPRPVLGAVPPDREVGGRRAGVRCGRASSLVVELSDG
ncbi:glycosyltransferase [Solicola sp. PLA-1-18]|uniref:glycosyltransferase n=1 Tax=Solicola sp. PLA-1-18 TaxID=3380532 RepID=UPI003B8287CC